MDSKTSNAKMTTPDTVITELQTRLNELGYGPIDIDNQYGPQTEAAYRKYLTERDPEMPSVAPAAETPWYLSRAMLGALATILAGVVGMGGWMLDSAALTEILVNAVSIIAGVTALLGTLYRKGRIDRTAVLPGIRLVNGTLITETKANVPVGWNEKT